MRRSELEKAYHRAIYRVRIGARAIDLRVGEASPALDAELDARGVRCWAWLTAVNPGSCRLPDADNRRRLATLDAELAARGRVALRGEALDPAGAWPAEPSRLVLGAGAREARLLATRWEQNAWLVGARGRPPELRWRRPVAARRQPPAR